MAVVWFCIHCGWQSDPTEGIMVQQCPHCTKSTIRYVHYDPETEAHLVQAEIDRYFPSSRSLSNKTSQRSRH